MATFRLEAVRARHGDALLLHAPRGLILIDGGAARVYDDFLKPRLAELRGRSNRPLPIRLLVVSHIDDDHVNGLLDLTAELIEADDEEEAPAVKIDRLWHNSFSDAVANESEGQAVATSALEVASAGKLDPEIERLLLGDTRLVLESVGQGRHLRQDARRLRIDLNNGFEGGLVLREAAAGRTLREAGANLTVVGPGRAEADKLKERWRKDVKKILEKERDRQGALEAAARLDRSVFNLSSIVLLAESEGRTMLLTGDARGDMILEWLAQAGLLDADGRAHYHLLKLPHHGSDRNVTPQFFERVTADHYVVSGDGRHGNPEPTMFEMLFAARGDADYTLHMTYGPAELAQSHEFDHAGLERVLDAHPGSRDRLRFPAAGERSIAVEL